MICIVRSVAWKQSRCRLSDASHEILEVYGKVITTHEALVTFCCVVQQVPQSTEVKCLL